MRILLVEDNLELGDLIAAGLRPYGFAVDATRTFEQSRLALLFRHYSALVLDLGLPDGDGLALLRELRGRGERIPVLVLTARGGLQDRVSGLRAGADDYLSKPFDLEELAARLEALLRRPGQLLGVSLRAGNIAFDTESRQVFIDGIPYIISAREAAVLEVLLRRKGGVVSKRALEDQLFGLSDDIGSNAVEVYVHRLRKQLFDLHATVAIHTVRGVGYLITDST